MNNGFPIPDSNTPNNPPLGMRPIGSLNTSDQRAQFDRGHSGQPDHVDLTTGINTSISGAGAHKITVDGKGNIIGDNIT